YPQNLRDAASRQLADLGVEIIMNATVAEARADRVILKDGRIIPTHTLVWSAGVKASPLAEMLGVPLKRAGRLPVEPTMQVIGLEQVYAAGDITYLEDAKGNPYPMIIPVAKQQAMLAVHNIQAVRAGKAQQTFKYYDRGIMATIGRRRAVAWIYNRVPLTGFFAWLGWLFLHLVMLMGFRNRLSVFTNWLWNYVTYDRSVRIIASELGEATVQPEATPKPARTPEALPEPVRAQEMAPEPVAHSVKVA
ncbi:MAG: FAD-dependent oxidoreductase, partial [Anaerolineae bacterium]|nr:FAD-dependent oxidoreductase [Anaerolineae bacterium]